MPSLPTPHSPPLLPAGTRIGAVHLRVAELQPTLDFYGDVLGLETLAEDGATAALGAALDGPPLVVLHEAAEGAAEVGARRPGLYHLALRLPDRGALGGLVRRVREAGWTIRGYADHNVSEAVYLADPEGNGVEIYADRAPDVWRTVDGEIFMTTEPLDVDGLVAAAPHPLQVLPEGTEVGHVHLRVSSLERAEAFYSGLLGLGVVTRRIPGALFLAAGSYHHHVGLNVWGPADRPRVEGAPGLMSFELVVPDARIRVGLTGGADEGLLWDPDHMGVRICRPPRSGGASAAGPEG